MVRISDSCFPFWFLEPAAFMPELGSVTFFFRDCFSCDFFRPPVGFRKSKAVSVLTALFCDATFTS